MQTIHMKGIHSTHLLKTVFDATNVLTFNPNAIQQAEARFIRAFAMYTVLDLYGQVPFREPGENLLNAPKVFKGTEAANFLISELEAIFQICLLEQQQMRIEQTRMLHVYC